MRTATIKAGKYLIDVACATVLNLSGLLNPITENQ